MTEKLDAQTLNNIKTRVDAIYNYTSGKLNDIDDRIMNLSAKDNDINLKLNIILDYLQWTKIQNTSLQRQVIIEEKLDAISKTISNKE